MTLATHHETILLQLGVYAVLTEFELSAAIAKKTNRPSTDVLADLGKWLIELRTAGLIWCGKLHNEGKQFMWAAALTKKGKDITAAL